MNISKEESEKLENNWKIGLICSIIFKRVVCIIYIDGVIFIDNQKPSTLF